MHCGTCGACSSARCCETCEARCRQPALAARMPSLQHVPPPFMMRPCLRPGSSPLETAAGTTSPAWKLESCGCLVAGMISPMLTALVLWLVARKSHVQAVTICNVDTALLVSYVASDFGRCCSCETTRLTLCSVVTSVLCEFGWLVRRQVLQQGAWQPQAISGPEQQQLWWLLDG